MVEVHRPSLRGPGCQPWGHRCPRCAFLLPRARGLLRREAGAQSGQGSWRGSDPVSGFSGTHSLGHKSGGFCHSSPGGITSPPCSALLRGLSDWELNSSCYCISWASSGCQAPCWEPRIRSQVSPHVSCPREARSSHREEESAERSSLNGNIPAGGTEHTCAWRPHMSVPRWEHLERQSYTFMR